MRRAFRVAAILAAGMLAGCPNGGKVEVSDRPPRPVDRIDELVVRVTPPTPMNWDDVPGSDGLQVQVNCFQREEPLSVTVRGTLEFLLYEGRATLAQLADRQPLKTWQFDGLNLTGHAGRSIVGWGYAMRLPWGRPGPRSSSVTLLTRYRPIDGDVKTSRPLQVAMEPK